MRRNASAETPRPRVDEELSDHGLALARARSDVGAVDRDVAPADRDLPFLVRGAHEELLADQLLRGVAGKEAHRDRVLARRRKLGVDLLARPAAQESVRQLQQQPRAVPRLRVGARGTPVLHLAQDLEALLDE